MTGADSLFAFPGSAMTEPQPPTQRQQFAQSYWDERASRDAHFSIWGDPTVLDPDDLDIGAFERSGEVAVRALQPFVHPEAVALEIGCGIGRLLRPLSKHCRQVIGVDISAQMIAKARDYLDEVSNATLIVGDGASLAGVEDGSVDFVYSLLVLIHVDKRSAYRYLAEIQRVLKPGGLALLQFQNMMSERGLELFQGVVASDYPFEFYTPEEVRRLMGRVGLEVYGENLNAEFIEVAALNGDLRTWAEAWRRDVAVEGTGRRGVFAGDCGLDGDGVLAARIENAGAQWRTVELSVSLQRCHAGALHEVAWSHAVLPLAPHSEAEIGARYDGRTGMIELEGPTRLWRMPSRRPQRVPTQGALEAHFAAIPSGHRWNEATARTFPSYSGVLALPSR